MKLIDKTILITGASSGIGYELAIQLAATNRLILLARREELLTALINKLPCRGHLHFKCDVSDYEAVKNIFQTLIAQNVRIDVAILNAGISSQFNPFNMSIERIQQIININLFGVINVIEQLVPGMLQKNNGLIAATGSLAGYRGMPTAAPYSASKAALATFLESLRIDYLKTGIKFTLISPGFVLTPMTARKNKFMPFLMTPEKAAKIIIRGLEKEKTEIHFPYSLSIIAKIGRLIPDRIYARLMHGRH
ncbi:SDR family NAD(P)-dependent oxidoreductase [candidate division KSB1 bacterium]|nr:SDR family NAD(P)-dependent oxidoreductase [candidate division KSB1 bacterium]